MYYTPRRLFTLCLLGCAAFASFILTAAVGQQAVNYQVNKSSQRLEMVVNSSRILTLDEDVPRVLVANPDVMRVVPLSPNQVQVSALKPGVTQVNLWDRDGNIRSVDVIIYADARQLELVLQSEFPKAAIRVKPIGKNVLLTGSVTQPEAVSRIVEVAETFYPKVINNIAVGGVHQVQLHVRVMEVSRSKLRAIGFDWANLSGGDGDFIAQSAAGLIAQATGNSVIGTGRDTIGFGIVDGNNQFFGFLEALRSNNLIKILAEPTLTSVSGRPAYFHEGGEFPVLVPQGLGNVSIEYKQFGTRVDFVPIVLGNGNIRLEVRPNVSEVDPTLGVEVNGFTVPGVRDRSVETAVEMRSGQTLAIAGLIQNKVTAENIGLPVLADLPWVGSLFRRVNEEVNEIELLIVVRPELIAPLDAHQVPQLGPGEHTTSPSDIDLMARGYVEVPKSCPDARCQPPAGYASTPQSVTGGPALGGSVIGSPAEMPVYSGPVESGPVTYPTSESYQVPSYEGQPTQNYQGQPTQTFEPFQNNSVPAPPEMNSFPAATPTARNLFQPTAVPATTGPFYPGNTQNQYRQVRAQVPVVPGKKSNLFGPSGYDDIN